MPNTSKSSKKASPAKGAAPVTEIVDTFTPVYLEQREPRSRVAEELSRRDGGTDSRVDRRLEECVQLFPVTPPTFFFDMAGQAVQTCVETQKNAIDLAVEQTEAVTEIAKLRAEAYSKITETATAAFQTTISRSVEAQKKVLEFAGAQNKAICDATRKQIGGGPATVVVDSYQTGANTVIEAQKSILEAVTKPFVA